MIHLIKAASDPHAKAVAHWRFEARTFDAEVPGFYTPSMRQLIDMQSLWKKALRLADLALQEQDVALSPTLPLQRPYEVSEFVSNDFDVYEMLSRLAESNEAEIRRA